MRCPSCSSTVTGERRFCPSCGTPLNVTTGTRVGAAARGGGDAPGTTAAAPGPAASASPFTRLMTDPPATAPVDAPDVTADDEEVVARQDRTTRVLPVDTAAAPGTATTHGDAPGRRSGRRVGDRLRPAGDAVRRRARDAADRYRHAPADVRLALVGTALTVVAFLALPYADEAGTAARLGGRLWWRPITAVVATALLASAAKAGRTAADRLLAAATVSAVGATEAGLVGLFSGDAAGARIGYYVMLAGLVMVLVAAVRGARRHCGSPTAAP